MKIAQVLWMVVFSAVLTSPTLLLSQLRQVPSRQGQQTQQAPRQQPQANAPPQVRQVAPRGSAPQARMSRSARQQAPRYQLEQRIDRRWKLGIEKSDAPQGVRVDRVYAFTAAADQLGLERGDYILDVQGYPVGYYQGTYYPLGDLLNQQADPQPRTTCLLTRRSRKATGGRSIQPIHWNGSTRKSNGEQTSSASSPTRPPSPDWLGR